jgi:hypothetical protein
VLKEPGPQAGQGLEQEPGPVRGGVPSAGQFVVQHEQGDDRFGAADRGVQGRIVVQPQVSGEQHYRRAQGPHIASSARHRGMVATGAIKSCEEEGVRADQEEIMREPRSRCRRPGFGLSRRRGAGRLR